MCEPFRDKRTEFKTTTMSRSQPTETTSGHMKEDTFVQPFDIKMITHQASKWPFTHVSSSQVLFPLFKHFSCSLPNLTVLLLWKS